MRVKDIIFHLKKFPLKGEKVLEALKVAPKPAPAQKAKAPEPTGK